jgi:hypothetical protein
VDEIHVIMSRKVVGIEVYPCDPATSAVDEVRIKTKMVNLPEYSELKAGTHTSGNAKVKMRRLRRKVLGKPASPMQVDALLKQLFILKM